MQKKMTAAATRPDFESIIARRSRSAPVDVAEIVRELGLEIYAAELAKGVSGVLVRDDSYDTPSGFVCFVNDNEPTVRQRFTAAHEIGHFVLHRDLIGERHEDNFLLRASGFTNRQETEANKFAADLLMPYGLVDSEMIRGCTTVEKLARRFNVSQIAMGIRLGLPT